MTRLTHFCMFIFLIIFFTIGAQEPTANQSKHDSSPQSEIFSYLLDFTENIEEDCTLPCFAGIYPGETTLFELQEFSRDLFDGDEDILAEFDQPFEREDGLLDYTFRFPLWDVSGSFDFSFIVSPEKEVLQQFRSHINRPENWLDSDNISISSILLTLEEPSEIYVSISGSQPSYFDIALAYESLGTLLIYSYSFEPEQLTQSEEPIPLCGSWSTTYSVGIWIQAVDDDSYVDLLEENLRLSETASTEQIVYRAFWPLEQMTNSNVEDLTQFLVENPEWCFDALSYEELLEAGYSY